MSGEVESIAVFLDMVRQRNLVGDTSLREAWREYDGLLQSKWQLVKKDPNKERELREHFRKLGFYREFPTNELLREAQSVYHSLEWPPQLDDDGDPSPGPPRNSKDDVIDHDEIQEIDAHALETPYTYLGQHVRYLVEYLIRPAVCDLHKARVITRWLGRCQDDDYMKHLPRTEWSHQESVAGYLWKLRKRDMDYDELFQLMASYAGLKCSNVDGCVRNTIKYEVGEDFDRQRKSWTAVLLDGDWRLLDVRWICEAAYGILKSSWCLIEDEHGKVNTRRAIQENRGSYKTQCRFREFYFLTDPEIFIYDHFPDDEKWQLLARKVSYAEARKMAALRADFFRHELNLRSHPEANVTSEDGNITFTIGLPKDIRMSFVYKLYRSKQSRESIDPLRSELERYVFLERDSDEHVIRAGIRLPSEGRYLFEIHGSENVESHHALLVTYVIICTGIKDIVKPLPPNIRQEWGPGEDTLDMGMVPVTHKKGQIEADDGDAEITFNLEKDLEFKHDLIKGDKDIPIPEGHVVHTIEGSKMNINVRLPEPGEYALNVLAKDRMKKTRFSPACTYLVSCDEEPLQSKPFPKIDGRHIGPNEFFSELGLKEEDPWGSYINNLVTGEFTMQIIKPLDILVFANLALEEGEKSETFDNYVVCDTIGKKVKITAVFPKSGTYKLTLFARKKLLDEEKEDVPVYTKIIEVALPTLTGMPSPLNPDIPIWCHGYHLREPRNLFLPSGEMQKLSIAVPEAEQVRVKGHPECKLKKTAEGYWEGYLKTGPPRSIVDIMVLDSAYGHAHPLIMYQVVSKEELLQIEVEQEQLFKTALDELQTREEEKLARLHSRLKQAVKDRNRAKIEKYLFRLKELRPDSPDVELVRAERLLRELKADEERDIARKELRKATRLCDIVTLQNALEKFKRLNVREEDGDLTSAEEVFQSLLAKQEINLSKTKDAAQQTFVENGMSTSSFVGSHSGVHIYVMPDGRVQHNEIAPSEFSMLSHSRLSRNNDAPRTLDNSADDIRIKEDFTHLTTDLVSTPRKPKVTDTSRVPQLLHDHLRRKKLDDSDDEIEPAEAALSMIENDEHIDKSWSGRRNWKSRTMEVFKKYWHVMKERSEQSKQTINDDIENEIQRLRHINQMCRKMSRAARRIGSNYDNLIDSEQVFHEILNETGDGNDSLNEDLTNVSALQQEVIQVEEGMKSAFDGFAKRMDELTTEMVSKAESTARELEVTRLEMATEEMRSNGSSSSTRSDSGVGSKDYNPNDAVKASFYAVRNTILEEIRTANAATEEEIRRQLSSLQKTMADYQGSRSGNNSLHEALASWKI
ncbi:hypothetical protein FSP39_007024 [Pinctada imbricata]|uniref:KY-like immunoglobulin-like domain-containing protein n=1 Tax=Pinctada imbricata TaxID=66713 RepID=A0AA88Y6P7_PINIB|nr:hypothetical protein FSP39_007024 [Pinctada imbricata]